MTEHESKSDLVRYLLTDAPRPFREIASIARCHKSMVYRIATEMRHPASLYAQSVARIDDLSRRITALEAEVKKYRLSTDSAVSH